MKEILQASFWEHEKYAKELSLIYPVNHPKRVRVEEALNEIRSKLNLI